ncbi:NUDIX hydrolase [Streptomyces sp. NPDC005732]|uniref:NUDIX hydrolase n=1 Tax=Streptomyces sp. NPDC005732 TaxID=3157057 RepID=UPI00340114CE
MSSEEKTITAIDGTDALAAVLIRPGTSEAGVAIEAWAKGIDKAAAAAVLRHVADMWHSRAGLLGVFDQIAAERLAQDAEWGEQNHPDGTGGDASLLGLKFAAYRDLVRSACKEAEARGEVTWALIDLEEDFEVLAETDLTRLRAELVQSAAVKVAWIQAIDRRLQQTASPSLTAAGEDDR